MRNNSVTFLYSGDCNTNGNTLGLAEKMLHVHGRASITIAKWCFDENKNSLA